MINFNVSEHHALDGFHLKGQFDNGYSVSIIPSPRENRVEMAIYLDEAFVESFDYQGETRFHMGTEVITSKEALEICNYIFENFPNT
jgi:hypothetical protein|tara:strand:+ start:807 stop:1067 length:261 start_codon:yes stop_codon:yes gene_type:complete